VIFEALCVLSSAISTAHSSTLVPIAGGKMFRLSDLGKQHNVQPAAMKHVSLSAVGVIERKYD
jgi:hypothetical protein